MSGNPSGGKAAAAKSKERYGPDFYKRIGGIGGKALKKKPSGFAYLALHDPDKLKAIGSKGGQNRTGWRKPL